MVSPLWKACADGDLQRASELLADATALDIELKDHTGVTPLIEAVRNGHVEVVRVLLDNGANPLNASSQGPPEKYTSDPAIVELLQAAQAKTAPNGIPRHQPVYPNDDQDKRFYGPPPPDAYPYYPTINPSLSTINDPGYYPAPQPPQLADTANGIGHLPPPDIARLIPCRYFPACRYGAQCMFAHPQTPYFQAPVTSVQYPPYDPMGNGYVPQYYFQQQPAGHPMTPMSPPPAMHARTPSEVISHSLGHFSPNAGPPPAPAPYGPLSPSVYPHPGQAPVSMSSIPPLPPLHPHAPHPHSGSQPHPNLYNSSTSPVPPLPIHQDLPSPYPMPPPPTTINYPDITGGVKPSPENPPAENYHIHPTHREGMNHHHRRGAGRRPSFSSRKPACLFFPAGRCKNGDDCRFPHVLTENGANSIHSQFPPVRGGPPRPRAPHNGVNGFGHLEAKLGNMTIRDEPPRQKNGVEGLSHPRSSEAGNHSKFQQGGKHLHNGPNSHAQKNPAPFRQQQRVPNADEFPVLAGSTTPPSRSNGLYGHTLNGNGHNGPTAAQVLQAPAPSRSKESSTRGASPEPIRGNASKLVPNGIANDTPAHVHHEPAVHNVNKVPVMSFAAVATAGTTDASKEVSVSA